MHREKWISYKGHALMPPSLCMIASNRDWEKRTMSYSSNSSAGGISCLLIMARTLRFVVCFRISCCHCRTRFVGTITSVRLLMYTFLGGTETLLRRLTLRCLEDSIW